MENREILLPNGVIIHTPYCLVVNEDVKDRAIEIACCFNSGCYAVFVHHLESFGACIILEGVNLQQLQKDHLLEQVWPNDDQKVLAEA